MHITKLHWQAAALRLHYRLHNCTLYIVRVAHHCVLHITQLHWREAALRLHHSASQCITSTIKSSWSISGLCAALINQKCLIFWSCWKRVMCQNDCKEIFCGLQELSLINKCLHGVEREIFWWWTPKKNYLKDILIPIHGAACLLKKDAESLLDLCSAREG